MLAHDYTELAIGLPPLPYRRIYVYTANHLGRLPSSGTERTTYGKEAEVSRATASADFRRLLDAGLVDQRGREKHQLSRQRAAALAGIKREV